MGCLYHPANIPRHQVQVAGFQGTDVYDHINLGRTFIQRNLGFKRFYFGRGCTQRETDYGADLYIRACQQFGAQFHPGGIYAHRGESMLAGFETQLCNLVLGGIWF